MQDAPTGQATVPHIPVMLGDVLAALKPEPGQVIVDATFGAGGYSNAFLEQGARVIAIDRDPDAAAAGSRLREKWGDSFTLDHARFSGLEAVARLNGHLSVDGVVADIGVSSMQIDQADRGFSFQKNGPLDMRMEQAGPSAADVVNTFEKGDLTRIIGILGEERQASRIAGAIVRQREIEPFTKTDQLARCVEGVLGRRAKDRIHPATRTFQALRMYVNAELDELAALLLAAERVLKPGGRLVVVSFHSLEDRLVKRFLKSRAEQPAASRHAPQVETRELSFTYEKRGAVKASETEVARNPRSRSAVLRSAIRTTAPVMEEDDVFGLPRLKMLQDADPARGARG